MLEGNTINTMPDNSPLVVTVKKLENIIKEKNVEIFSLNEKIQEKNQELKVYDKIMGFTDEMTIRDKKKHTQKSEKEEKKIKDIVKDLDPSLQEEYEQDLINEEDIVDLALQQNQLQFEINETFNEIKQNLQDNNIDLYKQYKRDLLKVIDGFYNIINDDYKNKLFDSLTDIIEKESQVYDIDEKIKKF
jgi:hypothetical protein